MFAMRTPSMVILVIGVFILGLVVWGCAQNGAPATQPAGSDASRARPDVEGAEAVPPEPPGDDEVAEEKPAESPGKEAPAHHGGEKNYVENELVIMGGGRDVPSLVKEFEGVIIESVAKTNTHQVRFPVTSDEELEQIAAALRKKGVTVTLVYKMNPPVPGQPQ